MSLINKLKKHIEASENTRKDWRSALGNKKQFEKSRHNAKQLALNKNK